MKLKICFLFICSYLLIYTSSYSQNVEFNDLNFKALLLSNEAINTNDDNEIQITEAESFAGKLELTNVAIQDLTGLEAFISMRELVYYSSISTVLDVSQNVALERLTSGNLINLILGDNEALRYIFTDINNYTNLVIDNSHLDTLLCWHNNNQMTIDLSSATSLKFLDLNDNLLSLLDVSGLQNLRTLNCDVNNISTLDLSNNLSLEYLDCKINPLVYIYVNQNLELKSLNCTSTQIISLDVTQNTELESLICDFTYLTFLDLSKNENLEWLDCYNSDLFSINVQNGNNINFQRFDLRENLNLDCIQVDDEDYSNTNWVQVPVNSTFKETCDNITGTTLINSPSIQFQAYPIPTNDILFIDFDKMYNQIDIEVFNSSAQLLKTYRFFNHSRIELNIEEEPGLIFLKIKTDAITSSLKVLKG